MAKTRKTLAQRKAEILAEKAAVEAERIKKQKQLNAQLAQLAAREKKALRKADSHLKIVIGAAVQAHARLHPAWAKQLHDVLHVAITKERDAALVKEWFAQLASAQSAPASPAREAA